MNFYEPIRNCVLAEDLSSDQTPFRKDEYERVRGCGARVLSVDQVEGVKDPEVQSWGAEEDDEGDPPRLWVQSGLYPGTAFTRSVGAVPEVKEVKITPEHLFFVVASDGVYEFLSSQTVVNMVAGFKDPRDACAAIAAESYKTWLEHESRTDDITLIVVHIKYMGNSDYAMTEETSEISSKTSPVALEKLPVYRYAFQGSGKSTELHACPDFTMERSPACVAPSPGHTPSSRTPSRPRSVPSELARAIKDSLLALDTRNFTECYLRYVLESRSFELFFKYVELPNFDIASDALATFKELLTKHETAVSQYLSVHYEVFFENYDRLLASPNYVTRRQSLKFLSDFLLEPQNSQIMKRYILEVRYLKTMIALLKDSSKNIQFSAFHIFKVVMMRNSKRKKI
ncbi:uncharacterized protein A4U43_C05F10500 [Asparagus officinalis]|uniref:protein-serine/threonine phosphatase n=1 Tax=Asparagus officinalis TaxID=4686 RepID=A0A5P1EW45_ASPOF|nr:uncharacterized protein A4U43_C05F10500 [Asparagus officinalis]